MSRSMKEKIKINVIQSIDNYSNLYYKIKNNVDVKIKSKK